MHALLISERHMTLFGAMASIKSYQKFKYKDTLCRWCNLHDETLDHILDCGEGPIDHVDLSALEDIDAATKIKVTRMTYRIQEFIDKVDY